ncbi:MAG: hypothetical protein JST54_12335 [Deltaproteobacteria bacterium]|nr:hypothetical protein [Deltaproteobacteria bacterium]
MLVWIDRAHAKLFSFEGPEAQKEELHWSHNDHHTHRRGNEDKESAKFYEEVAHHVARAMEVLIVGPGIAKQHFAAFLEQHHPGTRRAVVGVEAIAADLTDGELRDYGRRYFDRIDRMTGTAPLA